MTGNDNELLNQCKNEFFSEFRMKDIGEPSQYMGIEITQDRTARTLSLTQT